MSQDLNIPNEKRVVLGILEAVASERAHSQRHLAAELGVAVGLVNAYLRRCVLKGLLKVRKVPARRYVYYLTPKGFSEKSRLTLEYLAVSLSFFRQARADCADVFRSMRGVGIKRVVLLGATDLAEISVICALESGIKIVAVVDLEAAGGMLAGHKTVGSLSAVAGSFDAIVIATLVECEAAAREAVRFANGMKVFAPKLLSLDLADGRQLDA